VHGLPYGLILAARALNDMSSVQLVGAIESASTAPASGSRHVDPWWSSPQWAAVLDLLEAFERPKGVGLPQSTASGAARRATPVAVLCTPDLNANGLIDRLRQEGMLVCLTLDMHACMRIATSVGPDVVVIDPRIPRRLEQLLRAHPACSGTSIRWLSEPGLVVANQLTRELSAPARTRG
jgi:hypothetical protein